MADTQKEPQAKSTVRARKSSGLTSTQRFLQISEIHNDVVLLKNGGLRAVLLVEALNFNLKSETEQQGIISGYQSFVNTLEFPIQIMVRSAKMNIDPYIEEVRGLAAKQDNELLKQQTLGYADFVERLVDTADIMQKRFYVVIPFDQTGHAKTLIEQFFSWINPDDSMVKISQRHRDFSTNAKVLAERVNLIETGLSNIGLQSQRLTTHELIELYYRIYNTKTSQEQKLPSDDQLKSDGATI